jgi:hypothetical protein
MFDNRGCLAAAAGRGLRWCGSVGSAAWRPRPPNPSCVAPSPVAAAAAHGCRAAAPRVARVRGPRRGARSTRTSVGAQNLDVLRERLSPRMLRRRRADVLGELPTRTDTIISVELTAPQRAEHDELSLPIARLAHIADRRPLTQPEFLRLMSLLNTQRVVSNAHAQMYFESNRPRCLDEIHLRRFENLLEDPLYLRPDAHLLVSHRLAPSVTSPCSRASSPSW